MITTEQLYEIYLSHPVITTDTRNCPDSSLFFALKGERFNGNQFAANALEAGSAFAVVDEAKYAIDERYLLVKDVLKTLQDLARHHRDQLSIPVIGITGTNGKTTTKELTHSILTTHYRTLATEGNLNNHIGVPLTLLKITPEHEIAIIEMGANHPGEIEFLCSICRPDFGLITNIGKAHLEGFGSLEGVIKTKTELYASLRATGGKAFLHAENEYLTPKTAGLETILYGNARKAYLSGKLIDCAPFLSLAIQSGETLLPINTQLIGSYNLANCLAAAAIGRYFGISDEAIKEALENYKPANKRSQMIKTEHNTVILDAYNANPTSMMAALINFRDMAIENKFLILGDMRELGAESHKEHQRILDFLQEVNFEDVILVGEEFNMLAHPYKGFQTTEELKVWLHQHPVANHFILVKGSRGIALEGIVELL